MHMTRWRNIDISKDVFSDTALRIGGILVYLRYTLTHAPLLSGFLEILKQ